MLGLPSQLAAECIGAQPGMRVLDLCAAPGGKSLTMAEAMRDEGELLAGEAVPARLPLLEQAFARCGVRCARAFGGDASRSDPALAARLSRAGDYPAAARAAIAEMVRQVGLPQLPQS